MVLWKKGIYNLLKSLMKINLNLFFDFQVWGKENIPKGPKIFCSNHFSSSDPSFVITLMKEPVHMVIGSAFGIPLVSSILKAGEQISAFTEDERKQVIKRAADFLKKGESIYIFPEGDLNDQDNLRYFYSGLARIYLEYPVPIVPIGLISPKRNVIDKDIKVKEVLYHRLTIVSKNYYANIGKPMEFPNEIKMEDPKEASKNITEKIKNIIEELIRDIKENKFWS